MISLALLGFCDPILTPDALVAGNRMHQRSTFMSREPPGRAKLAPTPAWTGSAPIIGGAAEKTKGTPPGQHWLRGFGSPMPFNAISPCFFTTSAAAAFKIGLV